MEQEYYQVFSVDTCFSSYAINYHLIGAKDVDDLIEHLEKTFTYYDAGGKKHLLFTKKEIKAISKDRDWCIETLANTFTTVPYEIITTFGYAE